MSSKHAALIAIALQMSLMVIVVLLLWSIATKGPPDDTTAQPLPQPIGCAVGWHYTQLDDGTYGCSRG